MSAIDFFIILFVGFCLGDIVGIKGMSKAIDETLIDEHQR